MEQKVLKKYDLDKKSQKKIILRPNGRKRVVTVNQDPSRVDKSQQKASDVNHVVKRYLRGEQIYGRGPGTYGDFTNIPDYGDALLKIQKVQDDFLALPSDIRGYFDNDPEKLINFISDDKNLEKAYALGILEKPKDAPASAAAPTPPSVSPPTSAQPSSSSSSKSKKAPQASNDDD